MVIGLTGGIGCGKSTAAAAFAESGFHVVDSDALARQVLAAPGSIKALVDRWGSSALAADGLPDRRWIAAKVFNEPAEMAFLEALTHPEVARLRRLAVADSARHHVVELPLLFEKRLGADFDLVVCVACSEEARRRRLLAKGLTAEQIELRINSQMPMGEKVKHSDVVLWNDGDQAFLRAQVAAFIASLS
jgi:dephospho-CoA kinase